MKLEFTEGCTCFTLSVDGKEFDEFSLPERKKSSSQQSIIVVKISKLLKNS